MDTVLFHDVVSLNTVHRILGDLKPFYRIHLIWRILQHSVQKKENLECFFTCGVDSFVLFDHNYSFLDMSICDTTPNRADPKFDTRIQFDMSKTALFWLISFNLNI